MKPGFPLLLVVIGATAIGPESVLGIVGTAAVVRASEPLDIPVYVVASVEKALPDQLFARAVEAGTGQFEEIPLRSLRAVVTEIGVLDAVGAGSLAGERTVSRSLLRQLSRGDDE